MLWVWAEEKAAAEGKQRQRRHVNFEAHAPNRK